MRRLSLLCSLVLVGATRFVVPRRLRARWVAEWRAELRHRSQTSNQEVDPILALRHE